MTVAYPLDKSRDVDRKWVRRWHCERPAGRLTINITSNHNVPVEKRGGCRTSACRIPNNIAATSLTFTDAV